MIAIATSTRADWGLLTPLIAEFRKQEMPYTILASNMHLLPEMGMTIDEIRATGEAPVEIPTAGATISDTLASTTRLHGEWFAANRPQAVVILGDRYEMLGVASAATINSIPIIHIAGGTVSEGAMDTAIRKLGDGVAYGIVHRSFRDRPACYVDDGDTVNGGCRCYA